MRASRYASKITDIISEENISFLHLICTSNAVKGTPDLIKMYEKLFVRLCNWNNDTYTNIQFIDLLSYDKELCNLLKNTNIDNLNEDLLISIYNYVNLGFKTKINNLDDLSDFQKLYDIWEDKINLKDESSLAIRQSTVLLKYFQLEKDDAMRIIHSYLKADIDDRLYQNIPEAKYLKDVLNKIIKAENIEDLEKIENTLKSQDKRITIKEIYQTINEIKKTYGKEINSSLLQVDKESDIVDATNLDFKLLVHVVGAYGPISDESIYDAWNTKEKTSTIGICTSLISNKNMGTARSKEDSVILGFNNLSDNFLEIMNCTDIYSYGFKAIKNSRFLTSQELIDNTRHSHNELVINRRAGKYKEEKIQPSYVVCFDNIDDKSKDTAKEFGIPIIFIDREKIAEKNHNEIKTLVDQFKKTLDYNLIPKIICEQENNKAGLKLNRPDLVDEYFNQEFRQSNIDALYNTIEEELKNNNQDAAKDLNEFVKAIEKEVKKFEDIDDNKARLNIFDINYQELIDNFKNNPVYNSSEKIIEELSPEEAYKKFLECREKLSQKEKLELQELNNMLDRGNDYEDDKVKGK